MFFLRRPRCPRKPCPRKPCPRDSHAPKKTWLLFHNALSEGVVIDDILKYARVNKELAGVDEDSLEASSELKKLVHAQAAELELLKQRVSGRLGGGGREKGGERDAGCRRSCEMDGVVVAVVFVSREGVS